MLLQPAPKATDIVSFRLINGEEIIGKISSINPVTVQISHPIIVLSHVNQNGVQIGFGPYMVSIPEEQIVTFEIDKMLTRPMISRKDIADQYRSATSSIEIATPGQTGLLGF